MLTVLIPLGEIPYFVNANLQNYEESCGYDLKEIDFVFVTSKDISAELTEAIVAAKQKFAFRVWQAGFNVTGPDCHLALLESAIYENPGLYETIFIQHNDVFWQPGSNWLKIALAKIETYPDAVLFTSNDGGQRFTFQGKPVLRTHGDILALRQSKFVSYNLQLGSGYLDGVTNNISDSLRTAISHGEVKWTKLRRSASVPQKLEVDFVDSTDGADVLGLEAAVRFPDLITTINVRPYITHLWHFYDMYYDISRDGDKLIVDRTSKMAEVGMHYYSWVSSHLFDKDKMADKILPWQLELQHVLGARDDFSLTVCEMLRRYGTTDNVIGEGTGGIKEIQFADVSYPLK